MANPPRQRPNMADPSQVYAFTHKMGTRTNLDRFRLTCGMEHGNLFSFLDCQDNCWRCGTTNHQGRLCPSWSGTSWHWMCNRTAGRHLSRESTRGVTFTYRQQARQPQQPERPVALSPISNSTPVDILNVPAGVDVSIFHGGPWHVTPYGIVSNDGSFSVHTSQVPGSGIIKNFYPGNGGQNFVGPSQVNSSGTIARHNARGNNASERNRRRNRNRRARNRGRDARGGQQGDGQQVDCQQQAHDHQDQHNAGQHLQSVGQGPELLQSTQDQFPPQIEGPIQGQGQMPGMPPKPASVDTVSVNTARVNPVPQNNADACK